MLSGREELSTPARIKLAAIDEFCRTGFTASIRQIADRAGVTPGLVIHHFGSKAKLQQTCDDHVFGELDTLLRERNGGQNPDAYIQQLTELDRYAWILQYALRAIQAGGETASNLVTRITDDAANHFDLGVVAGTVRPSIAPTARARWTTAAQLGSLLVGFSMAEHQPGFDFTAFIKQWIQDNLLASFEVFTFGMLTETTHFDYLATLFSTSDRQPDPAED